MKSRKQIEGEGREGKASGTCRTIIKYLKMYGTDYRQISLMNLNAETLNKTLPNRIQQCIKRIIQQEQMRFILGMNSLF